MIAECFQRAVAASPILVHFDKNFQKYLLSKEFLQRFAGFAGHPFERYALMPNDYALLAFTLHIHDSADANQGVIFLEKGLLKGVRVP